MAEKRHNFCQHDIRQLLLNGQWRTGKKQEGTAAIWAKFDAIFDDKGLLSPYVMCRDCKIIYRHSGATSQLIRHQRRGCTPRELIDIREQDQPAKMSIQPSMRKRVACCSVRDRENILQKALEWCSLRSRPFEIFDDVGFMSLCQEFVDLGAKYGRFDAAKILPHSEELCSEGTRLVQKFRIDLKRQIQRAAEYNGVALSMRNNQIFAHFVNDNFSFRTELLGNDPLDETISEFKLAADFVMVGKTLPCMAQVIQEIICKIFFDSKPQTLKRRISMAVETCEKIYDESGPISPNIDGIAVYYKLRAILVKYYEYLKIDSSIGINCPYHVLEMLVSFVQLFVEVHQILLSSMSSEPSLHKVLPLVKLLRDQCALQPGDSMLLMELKLFAKSLLQQIPLAKEHMLASALDPECKSLRDEHLYAEMLRQMTEISQEKLTESDNTQSSLLITAAEALIKLQTFSVSEEEELQNYLKMESSSGLENGILSWWQKHQPIFPRLAILARRYLAIPATNHLISGQELVYEADDHKTEIAKVKL